MTDTDEQGARLPEELPEAEVAARGRLSMVWLIPLVALVIGAWLAYKAYSEQGPTVQISFKNAAGLEAGKTKVKFKDVEVGEVKRIALSEDLDRVVVTASLVAGAERYLTEGTRFWVQRPRVTASRVSGLETLLSGAYIAIDPVTEGEPARQFVGLEEPPLFTTAEPGTRFVLRSPTLGSLNVGSPVYYRSIQVGQVVNHSLDPDGKAVSIHIFINTPHDRRVLTTTRFWNASGLDFKLTADGIQMDTESLLSVVIGGIAFDTPESLEGLGSPAGAEQYFPLYPSRDKAHEKVYPEKDRYVLYFQGSVRGLNVGAPVLLRGIKLGEVLDVQLKFDTDAFEFRVPVLIQIEPGRIGISGDEQSLDQDDVLARLVDEGLRAQLKPGSLLTGQLYVDLDIYPDAPPASIRVEDGYRVVPTVAAPLEAITTKVNSFLDTLQALPLEDIGEDLRETVRGAKAIATSPSLQDSMEELDLALRRVRQTAERVDAQIVPQVDAALRQAQATLAATEGLVSQDSALYTELKRMIRELSAAARSIRGMADYLERHPEALIKGKGGLR